MKQTPLSLAHYKNLADLTTADYHAWERCVIESQGSFFQSPLWVTTWWKFFGGANELSLWIVREPDGRVAAVFPGMITQGRWWGKHAKVLTFVGGALIETADIPYASDLPDALNRLADAILCDTNSWDLMHVKEGSSDSRFFHLLASRNGFPPLQSTFSVRRPLLRKLQTNTLKTPPPLSSLSKNDINRRFNMLKRRFTSHIQFTHDPLKTSQLIQQFASLLTRRNEEKGYTSPFLDETHQSFFAELAATHDSAFRAHIATLLIADAPIALIYWLETPTSRTYYANTFNPAFYDYSPSSILMRELIRDFMHSPHMFFDFGRGEMPYKLRFANTAAENSQFLSAPRHPIRCSVTSLAWRFAPYIKRIPHAQKFLRKIKTNILP